MEAQPTCIKKQAEEINKCVTQESENTPAEFIVLHEPKFEIFLSSLHPLGNLFMTPTDMNETHKEIKHYRSVLQSFGVKSFSVREILLNFCKLEELQTLAANALIFKKGKKNYHGHGNGDKFVLSPAFEDSDSSTNGASWNEANEFYLSDQYKHEILQKTSINHLIDIILLRPEVKIVPSARNTPVTTEKIIFENHLGALTFTRDQQIITKKGLVLGRLNSKQRRIESDLMKIAWRSLDIKILGSIPETDGAFLEGGDFFPLSPEISLISCGLRTTFEAISHLMKQDWFGTEKVVVVKDLFDRNQDRMHLDTIFNVFDPKTVLLLESVAKDPKRLRLVDIYSKKSENSVSLQEKERFGDYVLIAKDIPFHDWLAIENYDIFYVSEQQQQEYFINFLNLGNKRIVSIHPDVEPEMRKFFEEKLKKPFDIDVKFVPFGSITAMYGGVRCASQVARSFHDHL